MELILNMMIGLGALVAAAYCMLLSRRLRALTRLDGDIGKAIAILSQQVDALTRALKSAEASNTQANSALEQQLARADATARRLELLMAAQHTENVRPPVQETDPLTGFAPQTTPAETPATEEFAPFARHIQKPRNEARARVLRQRDPIGAER